MDSIGSLSENSTMQLQQRGRFGWRGLLALSLSLAIVSSAFAAAPLEKLRVVATIPDLAQLATEIGGEHVEVRSLSKGTENLHAVHVRPSMLIALSKADLFLEMGLSLEAAWLPELLQKSRNEAIRPGAEGFQNCSEGWAAIGVPAELSRREGDVHPGGNPHFNLDPLGGAHLAAKVHAALVRVDPTHKPDYDRGLKRWSEDLARAEKRWAPIAAKLKGRKVAVYHTEYDYLAARLGMKLAASIEPKPGVPPTPGDIARIVKTMKAEKVEVILTAAWSNNRQVADIARKTGAKVVELPNQVKGAAWASTWIELMDGVHSRLALAYGIEADK